MYDIKKRRTALGLYIDDIAEAVGVSSATVSRWETGNVATMKTSHIKKLADVLRVSPLELLELPEQEKPQFTQIPVFESVSCGTGAYADGNIESYIDIPADMAKTGDFFALRVRGDSMEPEIYHNDIIVVNRAGDPREGQIVVAIVNGDEGFCKRFIRHENGIGLLSTNPAYRPLIFTKKDIETKPVRIVGTVEELIRRL